MITAKEAIEISEYKAQQDKMKGLLEACSRMVREAAILGKRKVEYKYNLGYSGAGEITSKKEAIELCQELEKLGFQAEYYQHFSARGSEKDFIHITIRIAW